jgi:sugar phosphate isomerase/epimerase
MSSRFHHRLALSLSLLCLSPLAQAEDKEKLAPFGVPGLPAAIAPLSADEMKAAGENATKAAAKLGWRIGCQAWTFNKRSLFDTIEQVHALGLHYLEAYPGQMVDKDKNVKMDPGMTSETMAAIKKKLADNDVHLGSFGVTGIPGDEAGARKFFDWAKEMGLETIVSEPKEEQFDLLNKLVDEYGINVAIHNHPQPTHYWNPDTELKVLEGRSKRIGSCADVGHWQRSGVLPIEALKKLEGRIIESHFKDLTKFGEKSAFDVPWGTGSGDAKAMLQEFQRQGGKYTFLVEYEHFTPGLVQDVAHSVKFFGETCEQLAEKK